MNTHGTTLFEMLIASLFVGVFLMVGAKLARPMQTYFLKMRISQQMNNDARTSMDAMTTLIKQGVDSSVTICSCTSVTQGVKYCPASTLLSYNNSPLTATNQALITCDATGAGASTINPLGPPGSQIEFDVPNNATTSTHWMFYWARNSVYMKSLRRTTINIVKTISSPRVLATNVSNLSFGIDTTDVAIVTISLQMAATVTGSTVTLSLPAQEVQMEGVAIQ